MRAKKSGIKLTSDDASIIKGMRKRGDRMQDIAAYFGVNSGRVSEIVSGQKFPFSEPANPKFLPAQGPNIDSHQIYYLKLAVENARNLINALEEILRRRP